MNNDGPKIAVVGAGSFVFSLGLLYDLIVKHRMSGMRLALLDVNEQAVETMRLLATRLAKELGVAAEITAGTDRATALQGADFVTSSLAVQLRRRWEMDKEVLRAHGIKEIYSECGGLGGLSYTLRQVALVLGIARDMERYCPEALLLNSSNPLPRITNAVIRHTGIRAVGFCNAALGGADGYQTIATLLNRDVQDINVISGGLNHFSWLLSATDRWTGEDLLPQVQAALAKNPDERVHYALGPLTMKAWRQYGLLPLAGDTHTGEFLPWDDETCREYEAHHGNEAEREARRAQLIKVATTDYPWQVLFNHSAWEHPADVINALTTGKVLRMPALNTVNNGTISNLPADAMVETPVVIADGKITATPLGALPPSIADICNSAAQVQLLAADAAATGDRAKLAEAIDADPAITEKAAAHQAIAELIAVHLDQLPAFR